MNELNPVAKHPAAKATPNPAPDLMSNPTVTADSACPLATSRIAATLQLGQQIWLDTLSRDLIERGTLARWIHDDAVSGLTSNPAIFQQAFAKDSAYAPAIAAARAAEPDPERRFEHVALPDIQAACDLFAPLWGTSQGERGYVSFEVSPRLAHDSAGTVAAAVRLWQAIDRPNAMIKIPATVAGCAALTEVLAQGINVNVTLIFSLAQLVAVQAAHLAGLQRWVAHCQAQGQPEKIGALASVASFFVSRTDSTLDPQLPPELQGKTAVALCKVAYERWQRSVLPSLAEWPGAKPQCLLWASTSAKNPAYRDTLYVDELIGPQTVNTVPDATLAAFRDHGQVVRRLDAEVADAHAQLAAVAALGLDLEQIGSDLQAAGLAQFDAAYADLLQLV